MATILIDDVSPNQHGAVTTSVSHFLDQLEEILKPRHLTRRLSPSMLEWSEQHLQDWTQRHGGDIDIYLGNNLRVIEKLRAHDWPGKIIYNAMGDLPRGASGLRQIIRCLYRTDRIWCSSHADRMIAEQLIQSDGEQPEITVIPYGIDTGFFTAMDPQDRRTIRTKLGFQEGDIVLGYVGRISLEKNVHSLFELLSYLHVDERFKLLIVGEVDLVPFKEFNIWPSKLEKTIQALLATNQNRVVHLNWASRDQVRELYNALDILLNLTLHHDENFGYAQIEAMSCGVPIVGTAWGGLKDSITASTGVPIDTWVTDFGIRYHFPKALAAVTGLAAKEADRRELGRQAAQTARASYSIAAYQKNVQHMIEEMLKQTTQKSTASLTEFGRRYDERFSKRDASGKRLSLFPRYEGLSDPDYRKWISPYASMSLTDPSLVLNPSYFLALPGKISGSYFHSTDLLWNYRVPLLEEERAFLNRLKRNAVIPAAIPADEGSPCRDCVDSLIRKGLLGISES
ncbi:glycosyltransferase family 4 protein [Gorillibacterium sp. CAU 1737]|uniref:glycosyltransferase family 4 protein n=1 Tax=Gorillibacterium sp. CAU 1737 TaxID=3140362 RepID=UPI0032608F18